MARNSADQAEHKRAQGLAVLTFICLGAGVYWLGGLLDALPRGAVRDLLQFSLYVAASFAVLALRPLTDFYQAAIARQRR